jgi:cytochrome c oxidase subunit II
MMGLVQTFTSESLAAAAMIPIHPPAASSIAEGVDKLYFFLTGITLFFTALIFSLIFYFMLRYRRRSEKERAAEIHEHLPLELTWTLIPTAICAVIFIWSSSLYFRNSRPPASAEEIFVIGKQWMWHLQHPEGPREINELHVPVGVPIKLTMTSQDVIHDFYIPAFRVKKDVLPGRYTTLWFEATKMGTYHLYCAQYCGAGHSEMIGWVYVMSPTDYTAWLAGGVETESMAQEGERLFNEYGCATCHSRDGTGRGPSLAGLYGKTEKLRSGASRVVDEFMVRQAIVNPNSLLLPNYPPIMPTFQGQLNEEQVLQLITYIKSIAVTERTANGK